MTANAIVPRTSRVHTCAGRHPPAAPAHRPSGALPLAWLGRVSADAGDVASAERIVARLRALAPARGLSPSLSASVCYHIDAHRRTTIRPSS